MGTVLWIHRPFFVSGVCTFCCASQRLENDQIGPPKTQKTFSFSKPLEMPRRGNYLPLPSRSKLRNSRRQPDSEINSAERVISSRFTLVSQAFRAAFPPAQQGGLCQEE